jgi:flagellar biosynthesis/type III secretory pathway chaperone
MHQTRKVHSQLKEDLSLLKSLLNLVETEKDLIKTSNKEKVEHFIQEKSELIKKLAGKDRNGIDIKSLPTAERQSLEEKIDEMERVKNKIIRVEEENRKNARNEMIMVKSLMDRIAKGKHTSKKYRPKRNKTPRYIDTVR